MQPDRVGQFFEVVKAVCGEIGTKRLAGIEDVFTDELVDSLVYDIFIPLGRKDAGRADRYTLPKKALEKFLLRLYGIAQNHSISKARALLARNTPKVWRDARRGYTRARQSVSNALQSLEDAKKIIASEMATDLVEGFLNFEIPRRSMDRLKGSLEGLESTAAAMVHPSLRTGVEEKLAESFRRKLRHHDLPVNVGSAQLNYRTVALLEDAVSEFAPNTNLAPKHLQHFISAFFSNALGESLTPGNVKTMIRRIRNKQDSPASEPPQQI